MKEFLPIEKQIVVFVLLYFHDICEKSYFQNGEKFSYSFIINDII